MKTSGVSCEPKFGLLVSLGHPIEQSYPSIDLSQIRFILKDGG